MDAKTYILQYFPDAFSDNIESDYWVWSSNLLLGTEYIGEGNSEEEAWEDAKQWIEQLPEENKPKIVKQ